jgi:hypothetical protein
MRAALIGLAATLLVACTSSPAPEGTAEKPGDIVYGFNENQRFFAFAQHRQIGEDSVYSLHMNFAGYNRVPDQNREELRLSSASVDPTETDVNTRAAITRARFSEQAQQLLANYRFPVTPKTGTRLFDNGSFVERYGTDPLPKQQIQPIKLMDGTQLRLQTRTLVREKAGPDEKTVSEAVLDLVLLDGSDSDGGPDPARGRKLLREAVWQAGIDAYWLRSGYLSPDGQKLVLLLESYSDDPGLDRHGRQALFTVGVSLRALSRKGSGVQKANQPGAPDRKFILSPAKSKTQPDADPAPNRTVTP